MLTLLLAHLHLSLKCCRHHAKPGSISGMSILQKKFGFGTQNLHGNASCTENPRLFIFSKIAADIVCNPAAYHYRQFYIENSHLAPKIYLYTLLLFKISTTLSFFKLLPTQCQAWQHNIYISYIILHRIRIQHQTLCRKPLIATIYWRQEISNYMLKNPA